MATADTILAWLRQAGDHAFRVEAREEFTQIASLSEAAVFRHLQEGPSSWLDRAIRDTPSGTLLVEEPSELLP